MAADTDSDVDASDTGTQSDLERDVARSQAALQLGTGNLDDPRIDEALAGKEPSVLSRTGDQGESVLTFGAKKEEPAPPPVSYPAAESALTYRVKKEEPAPAVSPPPAEKPSAEASGRIFGRQTIFHYNYDGSRDKEDPGSKGFFGTN